MTISGATCFGAAVNDAMADGDQFVAAQTAVDEFQHDGEHGTEVCRLARRTVLVGQRRAGLVVREQMWGRVEILDFASHRFCQ